jgi:hypothetical protein
MVEVGELIDISPSRRQERKALQHQVSKRRCKVATAGAMTTAAGGVLDSMANTLLDRERVSGGATRVADWPRIAH